MPVGVYKRTEEHLAILARARSHIKRKPLSDTTKKKIGDKLRKGSKYTPEEKQLIIRSRAELNRAVRSGAVKREDCHCGKKGEAHHPDYSKPLDVIWLCRKHHEELHRNVICRDFKPELLEQS